jgi:hypothetical protein
MILLPSLTLWNTSFLTRSVQLISIRKTTQHNVRTVVNML